MPQVEDKPAPKPGVLARWRARVVGRAVLFGAIGAAVGVVVALVEALRDDGLPDAAPADCPVCRGLELPQGQQRVKVGQVEHHPRCPEVPRPVPATKLATVPAAPVTSSAG